MLFLFFHSPWWSVFYKIIKMVDLQRLNSWLQDASLFCNEPDDYSVNFDDWLNNEKANTEGHQAVLGLCDLEWFDEKVDLSVLDNPNGLLNHPDETKTLMEDDDANLLGFLDGSFNPSYLPSDVFKDEDLNKCLDIQNYANDATSSEILDTHLASPQCTMLQVDSPVFFPVQSPQSPSYSDISEVPEDSSSSYALQSPKTPSITSDLANNSFSSPQVQVSVCDDIPSSSDFAQQVLSIEEVSNSVRKRKFVSNGEVIPKVKVIMKESCVSPVQNVSRPKDRRERKKVQNKEAAARYRVKKRNEEKVLSGEVEDLETQQKKLKEKHNELQMEIKYLKNLMCEMLQKKGIMK